VQTEQKKITLIKPNVREISVHVQLGRMGSRNTGGRRKNRKRGGGSQIKCAGVPKKE